MSIVKKTNYSIENTGLITYINRELIVTRPTE